MPNLKDIEKRINSVNSTKQITRTMEMVAAAKIRRATERMVAATPYADSMVETLAYLATRAQDSENALLQGHDEVKNVLIVVVVSDRGLAGGFNSAVFRYVERLVKQKTASGEQVQIAACGKKAINYFNYRKIKPVLEFRDLSADPTLDEATALATYAISGYEEGSLDEVLVVYNHAKNAAEQVLREEQVLPVDTSHFEQGRIGTASGLGMEASDSLSSRDAVVQAVADSAAAAAQSAVGETGSSVGQGAVDFEPSETVVLESLLPAYVRTVFYHALIDSAAAEQGARRTAMKSATDNANEIYDTLNRLYNRVRQGAITTEISEIVGGAAALEE